MLTYDPVLTGIPPTVIVEVTTAQINAPTAAMLADTASIYRETTAPFRWYRSNGSVLIELGSGTPGTMNSLVYSGGNLVSAVINGVPWTYTYDVDGEIQTMSAGGVTRTVSYTVGGDIDSVN